VRGVVGVGVDLVEVARLQRAEARWGRVFLERVFTPRELADAGGGAARSQRLAVRFAAKEAVFKALGTGRPALGWRDVEIVRETSGRPRVVLSGRASALARQCGVTEVLVSLSHVGTLALAEAVAVSPT